MLAGKGGSEGAVIAPDGVVPKRNLAVPKRNLARMVSLASESVECRRIPAFSRIFMSLGENTGIGGLGGGLSGSGGGVTTRTSLLPLADTVAFM